MTGTIFDIKRFAIHDGGGIRSTLFIKGCPLRCPWCQNPEGREKAISLHHFPSKCIGCGTCVRACPQDALSLLPAEPGKGASAKEGGAAVKGGFAKAAEYNRDGVSAPEPAVGGRLTIGREPAGDGPPPGSRRPAENDKPPGSRETLGGGHFAVDINTAKCDLCGICVECCPARALDFDGREVDSEEAVSELLRDEVFFSVSGGGVTLSGGEPFFQPEFSREVLEACHERGIDTAVETCLVCSREVLDSFIDITDQFIVDIKIFDSKKHREIVGNDNKIIFDNIEYLISQNAKVLIRTPLIPGFTTDKENLRSIGGWVSKLSEPPPMELINYNPLAENKFRTMKLAYPVSSRGKAYTESEMEGFKEILRSAGVKQVI